MSDKKSHLRAQIKSIVLDYQEKCKRSLIFYKKLSDGMPHDEKWKLEEYSQFNNSLPWREGTSRQKTQHPLTKIETAIKTMDEYLNAIEKFSDEQFAAFILGLGFNWIPASYWGVSELRDYLSWLKGIYKVELKVEAKIPEKDRWKLTKKEAIDPLFDLIPSDEIPKTRLLKKHIEFIEGMISVLEESPF